jgi:2-C-methyl-D-erythritol 4-phosphate cytidylyltransferase
VLLGTNMTHCLVLAAGRGERVRSAKYPESKQYQKVNNISPLNYLLMSLDKIDEIKTITVVIAKGDAPKFRENSKNIKKLRKSVIGGKTRQESSFKGLKNIDKEFGKKKNQKVIIHDAARPFVSKKLIKLCIKNLDNYHAVCPVIKSDDTLKKLAKKNQLISEDRDKIVSVQTPQGFQLKEIISLHKESKEKFTDDISLALEKK